MKAKKTARALFNGIILVLMLVLAGTVAFAEEPENTDTCDPFESYAPLVIQKLWDDGLDTSKRPEEIQVKVKVYEQVDQYEWKYINKIFTLSEKGFGKRSKLELYKVQRRGGMGIITFKVNPKSGSVVGAAVVGERNSLVVLTSQNKIIRTTLDGIRTISRNTQGVKVVALNEGAYVVGFDLVETTEAEE